MAGGAIRNLEHFTQLLDTLDAIVWEADASTLEFTYVSEGAATILGYPPQEWIGTPGFWESLIHPEDRDRTVKFCATAVRRCEDHQFEYRAIAADGSVVWLLDVVRVVPDREGHTALLRGVMTDITERVEARFRLQESEERYRLLSELTSDFVWSVRVDPDGLLELEWITGAIEEVYGRTAAELEGAFPFDLVHPDDRPAMEAQVDSLARGEHVESELRILRPDGSSRWIHALCRPVFAADGTLRRIVGSSRDISERKKAEAERERFREQLLQSQKLEAVGRLAGGIAHDFNNILAIIMNYAGFIRDEPQALSVGTDAQEIIDAAERGASLTHQLLVFSRRDAPRPQRLQPTKVIHQHARLLQRTLGENIELVLDLDQDISDVVADRLQIEQVLLNLALNARDAMPEGGKLTLALAGEEGFVRLSVSDTGTGMTDEVRRRALEPFFTTKGPGRGTGLGLAMVYGVVDGIGGSLEIDTAEGRGTTVHVTLPPAPAEIEGAHPKEALPRSPRRALRVLVVEDEEQIRHLVERALVRDGHEVTTARDGREAVDPAIIDGSIDLLITDVVMPGISGLEVARHLRERWNDLAVIYMSGYPVDVVQEKGPLDGPLLQKPFSAGSLLELVARVVT